MKVSQSWLRKHVDVRLSPADLAERLTMAGLEVEKVEEPARTYDRFVVGKVVEKGKHPNADRLSLCTVDLGGEMAKIVCGAPNVDAGQKVAVALEGAVIPHDQHDPDGKPFTLGRATIRGIQSNGMICSPFELGLGDDKNGILVLDPAAKPGTPLAQHLGLTDVIYDIGITPNRADCLSHLGIAREVAAVVNKPLKSTAVRVREVSTPVTKHARVRIADAVRCPRYCARVVRNVTIAPSPEWLQDALTAVGIRPINNVVDVTNYILMDTGHPLHAFDYDLLRGHAIVVRPAKDGEKFVTLDGKERTLTADMLMICDAEAPVAIAGVMGGANSEISPRTTSVLLEGAYFDPSNIRRTSRALGLSTEASYRFERGADIDMARQAVDRAAAMLHDLAGGEVLKGVIDVYPKKRKPLTITLRVSRANELIGISLTGAEMAGLLRKIGLRSVASGKNALRVSIPSVRVDLQEEVDLVEEVARMYGYNRIETVTRAAVDLSVRVRMDSKEEELKQYLTGAGFHEALSLSLQEESVAKLAGIPPVRVLNPVSAEMTCLRTSLLPGLLKDIAHNVSRGSKDLRFYEIGNVFRLNAGGDPQTLNGYEQEEHLAIAMCGASQPLGVGVGDKKVDGLDLRGEVEALLSKFTLDKYRLIQYDTRDALSENVVAAEISGTYAGFVAKIRKEIAATLDIGDDIFVFEISTKFLESSGSRKTRFTPLPRYPGVKRDVAFTIDATVQQGPVEKTIRDAGGPLLVGVTLFDVFTGQQAGSGKKSVAYALEFRALERTLTDQEVDTAVKRIVDAVRNECGGVLRG